MPDMFWDPAGITSKKSKEDACCFAGRPFFKTATLNTTRNKTVSYKTDTPNNTAFCVSIGRST